MSISRSPFGIGATVASRTGGPGLRPLNRDQSDAAAADTTHLIVFHAASAPDDYIVSEITGQAPFGSYSFDQLGSVDDTYRLWVTVMFDTIDPAVPTLADWADVIPPADC